MLAARPVNKRKHKAGDLLRQMRRRDADHAAALGYVVPFHPMIGHNRGPGLFDWDMQEMKQLREAHSQAWAGPSPEIARRRVEKAHEKGFSFREYQLEILERGRYLDASFSEAPGSPLKPPTK